MTSPIASNVGGAAKSAPASPELDKLKHVAKSFEAVFLRQMIGSMRSASLGDGMFDSSATQQFRDMSDARMADAMADKGALGVADLLVKQLGARLVGHAASATGASATTDTPDGARAETKAGR